MSDTNAPQAEASAPKPQKPVVPWPKWKSAILVVITLAAVGLIVNSSIQYEKAHKAAEVVVRPPPTYTGSEPLSILTLQEAWDSNNDFVIIVTPSSDAALNDSITALAVESGNKIRSTDRIYVGVYLLPANESLSYPTVTIRMLGTTTASYQYTIRADITSEKIYSAYLDRKYLRVD